MNAVLSYVFPNSMFPSDSPASNCVWYSLTGALGTQMRIYYRYESKHMNANQWKYKRNAHTQKTLCAMLHPGGGYKENVETARFGRLKPCSWRSNQRHRGRNKTS